MEQMESKTAPSPAPQGAEKPVPMKSWLLLCTLAIGYGFGFILLGNWQESLERCMGTYSLCWGIYLAGYYLCLGKRAASHRESWYLLGAALLLFFHPALYQAEPLHLINIFAIPLLLMLHAVIGAGGFPKGRAWPWVRAYIFGWFIYPYSKVDQWFRAIGGLFRKKEGGSPARRYTLLGILCGLPLLLLVWSLLMRADLAMGQVMGNLWENLPDISLGKLFVTLLLAMLFYSFLYNLTWGGGADSAPSPAATPRIPAQSFLAAASMLLVTYVIFAAFQFTYLTGLRGLPAGLTYSEYAVSGFSELLRVTAINLCVFGLGITLVKPHPALRPLLWGLLGATILLLLSAALRLGMYIAAYGLTWLRILSLWFMVYLGIVCCLCAWRLLGRAGLLRLCALALVGWYVVLNLVNVEAIIAKSVFQQADANGGILPEEDANYLRYSLSQDAQAVICNSGYVDQVYYDVAPEDWPCQ